MNGKTELRRYGVWFVDGVREGCGFLEYEEVHEELRCAPLEGAWAFGVLALSHGKGRLS